MADDSKPSYGGQAVIEGVMMRGPKYVSLAVRDPSGNICVKTEEVQSLSQRNWFTRLPVVRGALSLWESLTLGISKLLESAEIASPEEEKPTEGALTLSVLVAVVMALGLFIVLPSYGAQWIVDLGSISGVHWVSFIESCLRLVILVLYVFAISKMEDIQRVFEYHGAEHKVIWAFENNQLPLGQNGNGADHGFGDAVKLLAQKAQSESRLHPRCGTSFLFIAVLVTWVVFLFVTPESLVIRIISRIILLPVVAGLAYEVLKLSAVRSGFIWDMLKAPGMGMQKLTTKEPDLQQLEVAAVSLLSLIAEESGFSF